MPHDGTGTGWNETQPSDSDNISLGAQELRDLRKGVRIRLEKEHTDVDVSSAGGEHLEGSAKIYRQDAAPTNRPDGLTALDSDDDGRMWLESDQNATTGVVDQLNVFNGSSFDPIHTPDPPVGSVVAWLKSFTGTPSLPANWIECNGQAISDAESPFNGETAPDLNTAPESYHAQGRFLRGHSASGVELDDQFQGHDHSIPYKEGPPGSGTLNHITNNVGVSEDFETRGVIDDYAGDHGTVRSGDETRPCSYSVVWIMRIK